MPSTTMKMPSLLSSPVVKRTSPAWTRTCNQHINHCVKVLLCFNLGVLFSNTPSRKGVYAEIAFTFDIVKTNILPLFITRKGAPVQDLNLGRNLED